MTWGEFKAKVDALDLEIPDEAEMRCDDITFKIVDVFKAHSILWDDGDQMNWAAPLDMFPGFAESNLRDHGRTVEIGDVVALIRIEPADENRKVLKAWTDPT